MTKDDIIRMAREARGYPAAPTDGSLWLFSESHLERFAKVVAAAEREACAKAVLAIANDDAGNPYKQALRIGAEAIRARGQA
jgi:hypothetical protein